MLSRTKKDNYWSGTVLIKYIYNIGIIKLPANPSEKYTRSEY